MTLWFVEYLAKSIIFLFFDFYFIWNLDPLVPDNEDPEDELTFLEALSSYILDE